MNKPDKYGLWLPVTGAICLVIGLWMGVLLQRGRPGAASLQKLADVFSIIEREYVDPINTDSLVELAIDDILHNLDPHSVYIPAEKRTAANRDLEGSFSGVGIQFQMINDTLYIVEVISGAGADEAGLQNGDKIVEVDGHNIAGVGAQTEQLYGMLRGPEGTNVQVKVKRHNTPGLLTFDIVRSVIPVSPIDAAYVLNDSIAYIRLGKFSDNTYTEFLTTLVDLQAQGARNLILDLRGNGGGYMAPSVMMANELLPTPGQVIVSTKGRNYLDERVLMSDGTARFGNMPVVVLIDEFTASSSEILAGALQDNDRALIVGRRSFGKGLVQTPFELADSSEFRLTVQRYFSPSGRCIQKDYKPGHNSDYDNELVSRYSNGEIFSADSMRIDSTKIFYTAGKRPVFGGGGIVPDVFVPSDTSGVTSYYIRVANEGLLRDFAYDYADLNRDSLNDSRNTADMLTKLPSDATLLQSFVRYAQLRGVAPRWYYINTSAPLIVNQIKALIARDIIGMDGYYEVYNTLDSTVQQAVRSFADGSAKAPVTVGAMK